MTKEERTRRIGHWSFVLGHSFVLGIWALVISGCSEKHTSNETLIIISPHREEIRDEVEIGFRDWLKRQPGFEQRDVQIEWRDIGGGTSQIMRYLDAQYKAYPDGIGIDLLYGGGTDIYLDLKARKQLERYELPSDLRDQIRQNLHGVDLRDPDGYWHGVMLTTLGVLCNREVLDRLGHADWFPPKRWQDLADERLLGWISAGDPRMSGSVHLLYEWLLQVYGWDEGFRLLMRLGANARGFNRYSDGVSRDVLLSKSAAAGVMDTLGFTAVNREQRLAAGRNPLSFVLIPSETIMNPDSIGILKGAPHRRLAELFVEWNLREDGGQQLWMLRPLTDAKERERYPGSPRAYNISRPSVMESLYDSQKYPQVLRSVPIDPFDEKQIGRLDKHFDNRLSESRRRALNDLFGAWIIDTHPELSAAWRAVTNLHPSQRANIERPLFDAPIREKDLSELRLTLTDPRRRAEIVTSWQEDARKRYRSIRAIAEQRVHSTVNVNPRLEP
jgi:iron(III) transport system substrate-binding protein